MMKVALVHDYLFDYGGAERVLEALHEIYPEAPVYTAWADYAWIRKQRREWCDWEIRVSWFQNIPWKRKLTSPLRFLAPFVWESLDLSQFDVVISSAAWFITKGLITRPETLHVCYCHTPPRYLYGYPTSRKSSWLTRLYAGIVNPGLRMYDFLAAQRVDVFVANSENVKRRIEKFYRREAIVVYPPIGVFSNQESGIRNQGDGNYFLMVNRLVGPKRVDIAIEAAKKSGVDLKIVGSGPEENRLRELADKHIEFLGYVDDDKLATLYANCKAVIYLGEEEDFGITPVEAMSFGKPVIGAKSGGIVETVNDKTGVLLEEVSVGKLAEILKQWDKKWDSKEINKQAEKFSKKEFQRKMKELVETEYNKLHG